MTALAQRTVSHLEFLLSEMTMEEKVGQLQQLDATGPSLSSELISAVQSGLVGSVINQVDVELCDELQRIAVEESRLGIPLVFARDVIHGFNTVFPIPLGQAATWNPELVKSCASFAAAEASRSGVHWTFAPMIDVSRDPRWGRIAESFGEDPYLNGVFGAAMIEGFQGDDLTRAGAIAACAKHFVGYGAAETGIDYNSTNISEFELHNNFLPPFKAAVDAGVVSIMPSLSDIDGVPATANGDLICDLLRDRWGFDGAVVSDWDSIRQLQTHGISANDKDSAELAAIAHIDIEMTGDSYRQYLPELIGEGRISIERLDAMVMNVLSLKKRLGLFDEPYTSKRAFAPFTDVEVNKVAKQAAEESIVLLQNTGSVLPLDPNKVRRLAIIGPMADQPYEQLGTWIFDGDPNRSITPLTSIRNYLTDKVEISFSPGLPTTRAHNEDAIAEALKAAEGVDTVLLFVGEESILSGEAHCRADINLPGAQAQLAQALKDDGHTIITVIMAGRPLTLGNIIEHSDALLFAWHPGSMAGPAICELIFGLAAPSGKLPVTFPKTVGQVPIYYNRKNTGRPTSDDQVVLIDDIPDGATQTSFGMTAFHLDVGHKPAFPFGFGLSYTEFEYSGLELSTDTISADQELEVSVTVSNIGSRKGQEVAQLYVRDLVGSVTRPVKELKRFEKISLDAGESKTVTFSLSSADLAFYRRNRTYGAEPGAFELWVGGSSEAELKATFNLK